MLGGIGRAGIVAREGFCREGPDACETLARTTIALDKVQAGWDLGERKSHEVAAKQFGENSPKLVHYRIKGAQ